MIQTLECPLPITTAIRLKSYKEQVSPFWSNACHTQSPKPPLPPPLPPIPTPPYGFQTEVMQRTTFTFLVQLLLQSNQGNTCHTQSPKPPPPLPPIPIPPYGFQTKVTQRTTFTFLVRSSCSSSLTMAKFAPFQNLNHHPPPTPPPPSWAFRLKSYKEQVSPFWSSCYSSQTMATLATPNPRNPRPRSPSLPTAFRLKSHKEQV